MIGQTLSHYRILEKIGAGGMGVVYRAHDERLDRDVALKVLPPGTLADEAARKCFRKEALTLSRLNHPNIETVHDFDTQDGVDLLVMEHIAGVTLDKKLAGGALPEKDISRLGVQLAEGLAAAHQQGIVHLDLKPSNLLVTGDGRLKILDFGIAKLLHPISEAVATASLTEAQPVAGTLPYMAPEQLRGEKIDPRSDIWSAGAVLYEMAAGRRPFREQVTAKLIDAILHQAPVPPRSVNARVSAELERIILKCLEKDPEDRYQSARELSVDLRRLGAPASAPAISRQSVLAQRWPLAASVAAIALLAVLVLGFNLGGWRSRALRGAGVGRIESLAVLPLQNLSGDPAQEYFADGMTEELTAEVAQLSALRVISRTSVMQYKGGKKPLRQIARELNVDAVVEGSVQRSGNRVRVIAQLIYAPTDRHLWARTYERDLRDVLALQDEVAQAIAREVGGQLNPRQQAIVSVARRVNPEAYESYLRGRSYLSSGSSSDLQKSIDYFNQAIKLDSDYAPSYSALASAYYFLGFFNLLSPNVAFGKMKDAALRALERDDTVSGGHDALGLVKLHYEWDWEGAEKEFKRALELNPNDADTRHDYAHFLMAVGRLDESVAESNRAVELDPVDTDLAACLCWHRYAARQYPEAIAQALKTIQLEPNEDWTHIILGWNYEQVLKFDEAIQEFQTALKLSGGSEFALAALGHAFAASGRKQQAEEVLAKLREQAQHGYVSAFDMAVIYTGLNNKERAFEWLQKAVDERSSFLIYSRWEPRLDPLRSDPRFQSVLHRMGLPT